MHERSTKTISSQSPTPDGYGEWKFQVRQKVEDTLEAAFGVYPDSEVRRAAEYATLGGGHRWRPLVSIAAGLIFRDDALDICLPGACGFELAHAASLILDDLPSMDDAALRRGKPCTHKVFSAWAVDMAPVFLVNMSYDVSLANERVEPSRRIETALIACRVGMDMISGQSEDVLQDSHWVSEERLFGIYRLKSGALYAAAGKAGALSCGASGREAQLVSEACMCLGVSYQLMDDVADVEADTTIVGKASGMDIDKYTAVDAFGVEGAKERSAELQKEGLRLLSSFGRPSDYLRALVGEASWKSY